MKRFDLESTNSDLPATPFTEEAYGDSNTLVYAGLTKREYFAGLAMQGMLAASITTRNEEMATARDAVSQADELLKALDGE